MTSKEINVSYAKPAPTGIGSECCRLSQIRGLSLLLAFAIAARIHVALFYEVNWDEFYYLSFVYQYENGVLSAQLQTFHVHFFNWLKLISSNEVTQIKAARLVLVILQSITGFFIYRIARRMLSPAAAIFAVLCYFAFSFNIRMGASFRSDPIVTFFLMASLALVLSEKLEIKRLVLAGACIAIAVLISIKSLLYLPTFGLIAIALFCDSQTRSKMIYQVATVLVVALAVFVVLYFYHGALLNLTDSPAADTVSRSFDKTIKSATFLPGFFYLKYSLLYDLFFWITLIYGVKIACVALLPKKRLSRQDQLILLSFTFPLCTIFFYRNAFPYFYSFMLAPATVLCGLAWDGLKLNSRSSKETTVVTSCILFFMALSICYHGFILPKKKPLQSQQEFVDLVHTLFPSPTSYIDCCSMISSYPQAGFFMSSWGMDSYIQEQRPILKSSIERQQPTFLIANNRFLDHARLAELAEPLPKQLLHQDLTALEQNYIPHWGALYVAGKHLYLQADTVDFMISIPGEYTLEGTQPTVIDKQWLSPGETVYLAFGKHIAEPTLLGQEITFRWGNHLYRPPLPSGYRPIFTGF
ncbi:ArnT family glycosyltransferase [Shewanella halifaxensis]|uniref:ArnT family glycosyltransferase n=1 Tax=Shewanella halifaxensis TaxID=271098 RepID=UPI00167F474F|nr:glycosyltransferase family 39 protein [Shewanella halifaxensis]